MTGKPGTAANSAITPPPSNSARGWVLIWLPICVARLTVSPFSGAVRVTTTPAAIAMNSAGICVTSPSPIASTEYFVIASPSGRPNTSTPTARPPSRLAITITMLAAASPLTNFIAPSIAPKNWLSRPSRSRSRIASGAVIKPARRSESIAICLPGKASSVKRAPTSATRSAPLAMTMNCTMVMMKNTTNPTIRLPPTTMRPKASMMSPACPDSRICRVVATFSAIRNNVVKSSTDGKVENASGVAT